MASIGDVKKVKGENGDYLVETLENGYSITKEGETASMELIYNKELNTWNVVADGVSTELLQMNNDGTAQMTLPNGEEMTVTLDAQGVAAARQATMIGTYYAFNKWKIENGKWLVHRCPISISHFPFSTFIRTDIPQQSGKQNRG